MATARKTSPKPAGSNTEGVRVVSRPDSFFRAGRRFTAEATVIPLSELTTDELEALEAEPKLICTRVAVEPADATGT